MTQKTKTELSPAQNVKVFFIVVFLMFAIVPAVNFFIDPTGIFFKRERILDPDFATSWIPMEKILAREEVCKSYVFGTSRIVVWDTNALPGKPCKMSYPGKGLQSFLRDLKTLIDNGVEIERIIITVGVQSFYNHERYLYEKAASISLDYPSTLHQAAFAYKTILYANTFTNIEKLISKPEIGQYWKKSFRESDQDRFRQLKYRWEPDKKNVKWNNPQEHTDAVNSIEAHPWVLQYRDYQPQQALDIIQEIISLSKRHNFHIKFIKAPVLLKNIVATNKNEFLDHYKQLAEITPYYDFSYNIEFLKAPSLWIDYTHYKKKISDMMVADLNTNQNEMRLGKLINRNNVDAHISQLEENIYKHFINTKPLPPNTIIDPSWLN